ncbi:hypothetical protein B0H11DRAFT_1954678 [Mycena galericulata]|nr:hypothetical protein B0H11DRAFT_1954678 [Mycena galericulata]
MRVAGPHLLFLSLLWRRVSAVLTNYTIDDQAPSAVSYVPGMSLGVTLATENIIDPDSGWNGAKLFNGTYTTFTGTANITFSGVLVYVFLAHPEVSKEEPALDIEGEFLIDDVPFGKVSLAVSGPANSTSFVAYINPMLSNGPHKLTILATSLDGLYLDYVVYTTEGTEGASSAADSSLGSSSAMTTSSATGTQSPSLTQSQSGAQSSSNTAILSSQRKFSGAFIGGATTGCVAGLLALLVGLLLCRRARSKATTDFELAEKSHRNPHDTGETSGYSADVDEAHNSANPRPRRQLAEEVRLLREELQELRQSAAGSSSIISSDSSRPTSVTRSVSTMKRAQTLAVHDYQERNGVRDSLVHTDSGLRLSLARGVVEEEELPPNYLLE